MLNFGKEIIVKNTVLDFYILNGKEKKRMYSSQKVAWGNSLIKGMQSPN